MPFGSKCIEPYLKDPGLTESEAYQLMIYPNAAKDTETSAYPYVELFRDFAAAVCRPNSTLVTYGYGFGDEQLFLKGDRCYSTKCALEKRNLPAAISVENWPPAWRSAGTE